MEFKFRIVTPLIGCLFASCRAVRKRSCVGHFCLVPQSVEIGGIITVNE